jgi:GNAT superfamily N-acetyltransferase
MEFRKFKESDADEVSKIITEQTLSVFSKHYPQEFIDLYVLKSRPEEIIKISKKKNIFVAVDGERIIGTGSLRNDAICTIFVDTSYQGKGVGKAIMAFLEKTIKQKGATVANLTPVAMNAVGFYKKLGYSITDSFLYRDIPLAKAFHMVKEL